MSARTLQVDVTDLAETMDFAVPDGLTSYIDLRNGALVHAESPIDSPDALAIPPFDKDYRYQRMVAFVATLDGELATVYEVALGGQGAFRRFKNLVHQHGLADAWSAFQLRSDRAEAMAWLAREGIDVIDVSTRLPPGPDEAAGVDIGLVDVLLLGAPGGKTELVGGQVVRRLDARTVEESHALFRALARAIAAETGATLPGSTGKSDEAGGGDALDAGRFHLRRHDDVVELAIDVPRSVWDRFST